MSLTSSNKKEIRKERDDQLCVELRDGLDGVLDFLTLEELRESELDIG